MRAKCPLQTVSSVLTCTIIHMKTEIDIKAISNLDAEFFTGDNWCPTCKKADTGIDNPYFFKENGNIYVQGNCLICSSQCISEITLNRGD